MQPIDQRPPPDQTHVIRTWSLQGDFLQLSPTANIGLIQDVNAKRDDGSYKFAEPPTLEIQHAIRVFKSIPHVFELRGTKRFKASDPLIELLQCMRAGSRIPDDIWAAFLVMLTYVCAFYVLHAWCFLFPASCLRFQVGLCVGAGSWMQALFSVSSLPSICVVGEGLQTGLPVIMMVSSTLAIVSQNSAKASVWQSTGTRLPDGFRHGQSGTHST